MRVLEQMARVLQEAHELGVIHRDIKPDNIIVTDTERWDIKLLDFGIAKDTRELHTMVSQTGQVIGTPAYMSPEQCEGKPLDIRSDLYSLGVTAYQMLAGKLPFPGPTTMAFMKQHLLEEPPPLRESNPTVSEGMEAVVRKMLAKDPARRYQTPQDVLEDINRLRRNEAPRALLELTAQRGQTADVATTRSPEALMTFAEQTPGMASTEPEGLTVKEASVRPAMQAASEAPPEAAPVTPPRRRSAAPIIVVVLLLVAGGGFAGYWFFMRKKPPKPRPPRPHPTVEPTKPPEKPVVDTEKIMSEIRAALLRKEIKAAEAALKKLKEASNVHPDTLKKAENQVEVAKRLWELERLLGRKVLGRGLFFELLSARKWARVGGPEKVMQYLDAVLEGEKALSEGRLDDAEEAFERARMINNGALVRDGMRRLGEARRRGAEAARQRRVKRYMELVRLGWACLDRDDLVGAEQAFREAIKLFPMRRDAHKGLEEVRRRARQRKQELREKLNQARKALKEGNWQKAQLLAEEVARLGEGEIKAEALNISREAKRFAKYGIFMEGARRAMKEGRFLDAKAAFEQAARLMETREAKDGVSFCTLAQAALEAYQKGQWEEAAKRASWALASGYHPVVALTAVMGTVRAKRFEWFKLRRLASFRRCAAAAVDEEGRIAAVGSMKRLFVLTPNGQSLTQTKLPATPTCVAFRAGMVAVGFRDGCVGLWRFDGQTLQKVWLKKEHFGLVSAVGLSREGMWVYSGGADGQITRLAARDGKLAVKTKCKSGEVTTMLVLGDGRVIFGHARGSVSVWSADLRRQDLILRDFHKGGVRHLSSSDPRLLLSVGDDNIARVWAFDLKKGAVLYRPEGERLQCAASFFGLLLVGQGRRFLALVAGKKRGQFAFVRRAEIPTPTRIIPDLPRLRVLIVAGSKELYEFALEVQR